jgi:hypothetical protein
LGEELARDERVVTREEQDLVLILEQLPGGVDRGPGPLALALLGHLDSIADALGYAGAGPGDDDNAIRLRPAGGLDDPIEHGTTADRM